MARQTALIALALLAAAGLAACGSSGTADEVATGPLKLVDGGSTSYEHHASVTTWGSDSSRARLAKAARAEHAYLVARVEKDWAKACSYLSEPLEQRLAARSESFARKGCAKAFASISEPIPAGSTYAATEVEADSLRASGFWAFLLYRAAGTRYFMPMLEESDGWTVNKIEPRPFVTSTAARG